MLSDSGLSTATPPPPRPGQQPQRGLQVDTEAESHCGQSRAWVTSHEVPSPKGGLTAAARPVPVWRFGDGDSRARPGRRLSSSSGRRVGLAGLTSEARTWHQGSRVRE